MPSKQKDKHVKLVHGFHQVDYGPSDEYYKDLETCTFIPPAGVKHDKEKRQWALLPWRELGKVADVMTHGAKKYSADNWMHVPGAERRYFEAAMRHITARQAGEINDPESRLPHLAHAVCCLLFHMWFDTKNRRGHR